MRTSLFLAESDPPSLCKQGMAGQDTKDADIFRRNRSWLLALLKLHSRRDAEDLLQETFLRAAGQDFSSVRHPRAWLAAIALNVVREQHRRRTSRVPASETDGAEAFVDYASAETQHQTVLLKQIILSLPPKLAEVLVLSRFEGLTYPEIAQRCGISARTVEWRMSKALAICAARLKD